MEALVGHKAPDFTAKAIMPDNAINAHFNLAEYIKHHYTVIIFYPLDFTFVCPSELIAFHDHFAEFNKRNTKLLAISVDSQFSHLAWKKTSRNQGGIGHINFPLVSDLGGHISKSYNVLHENVALRATFFIDAEGIIRHMLVNDLSIGRDVEETLRVVDAFKLHQTTGDVCPAGWKQGRETMQPTEDGVIDYLSRHANSSS